MEKERGKKYIFVFIKKYWNQEDSGNSYERATKF